MRSVSDLGETPVEGKGEWELEQVGRAVQTRRRRGKEGGLGRTSLGDRAALREFGQHGRSSTQSRDRLSESLAWTGMAGPFLDGEQPVPLWLPASFFLSVRGLSSSSYWFPVSTVLFRNVSSM